MEMLETMPKTMPVTGPGGTEFITHPTKRSGGKAPHQDKEKAKLGRTKPESPAYQLRQAVERARQALATAVNGQREALRYELDQALSRRQQFWIDTCREVQEMRAVSRQVLDLNMHYGCRFCPPNSWQVQHILDALDAASDTWDRDHPQVFYQTMELNFRELRRVCRARDRI
jgi:hypothetical protein